MNFKKTAFNTAMITSAIVIIGWSRILNYDNHPFYQEDLDAAYRKAWRAECDIHTELERVYKMSYNETKTSPEYKQIDSLSRVYAEDPENNWYLDSQINSLWQTIDSVQNSITKKNLATDSALNAAYQRFYNADTEIEKLTQDSIINDSIKNQPWGQRFKNNWDKIFSQQKQR